MHDAPSLSFLPLLIFIAFIVIMAVLALTTAQQQQRRQVLAGIASRFHGRFLPGDLFSFPEVRLRFQGYPAVLRFSRVGKNRYHTHFSITWPEDDLRCEIHPQNFFSGLRTLLGMEDLQIGSPKFDADYFISGNHVAEVRQLLSSEVQAIIWQLAGTGPVAFLGTRDIQVKWAGGAMTVTKPAHLTRRDQLEPFILLSAGLFKAALATRNAGIEFVGDIHEPDTADSQCQVCGEPLADDLVHCQSCRTPHHRECWEYFGGCSTYACGVKKFVTTKRQIR